MREHIYKAKRRDNHEWIVGYYCKYGDNHCIIEPTEFGIAKGIGIIPETLCEFTGLYDKNGKRIWENDIVKTKFGRICKVVWRQTQCFVGWDFEVCDFDFGVNDFSKPPSSWDLYLPENLEVVGNSIDNAELLTAERIGENED
jgi:uncharacterized phage protein (TIGR01671 family)